MHTSPVVAARAAVATRAWVKSKHMYLIRGSVGAFIPIRWRIKKQKSVWVACLDGYDGAACVEASDLNGR